MAMADTCTDPSMAEASTQETASQGLLCPFTLQLWAVDRMLNCEITDDPHYEGLELQVFNDPAHGRGLAVLLRRRGDGRLDIYRQPGLVLDPEIAQVGGELGEWLEAPIHPARFDISPDGVDVDVRLTDTAGRVIEVRIDDRDGRRRHRGTLLAPVGAVVQDPASLSLFVMGGCDLVRRSGRVCDIRIDGRPLATGRLPGGWLHRRRLIKYTADPIVVLCNQTHDGPPATIDPRAPGEVELAPRSRGISALRGRKAGHRARLTLTPAFPDVTRLRPQMTVEGTWQLGIDANPAVVGGSWSVYRRQERIELVLDVDQGWRPKGLPLLMTAVTKLAPVFHTWPTTYRWTGAITLGDPATLSARWERKSGQRDQSYQRLIAPGHGSRRAVRAIWWPAGGSARTGQPTARWHR
jgi:hypothetical protein